MTFTGSNTFGLATHIATADRALATTLRLAWELTHQPGTDTWTTDLLVEELPCCPLALGSTYDLDVRISAAPTSTQLIRVDGEWEQLMPLIAAAEELAGNPGANRLHGVAEPDPIYI